jgi:histidine ammonia-lyase
LNRLHHQLRLMIGMGPHLPLDVVRAAQLARVIGFARGGTGVSLEAAQAVMQLLDRGVTPVVPMFGSIGAGDLGLSAHLAAPVIGQGEAFFQGQRYPGAAALQAAGLQPVRPPAIGRIPARRTCRKLGGGKRQRRGDQHRNGNGERRWPSGTRCGGCR